MDVLAQLARNTGYSVRVNHKVSAASNKQGNVELWNFGLDGSNSLVIDVLICCHHIGSSKVNNRYLNSKIQINDHLKERAGVKNRKYRADHAVVGTAFAPAMVSVAAQIHPEFFRLLWVLADKQTRNYYVLISAEEEIGSEAFTWSRAHMFCFNKNSIGKAIATAAATRIHHSLCTVQLRQRVIKLARPCPLLNVSCTALHMHRNEHPPAPHPLTQLSMWMLVHTASSHLLMLLVQVLLAR